jgi:hypothetical protein
MIAIDIHDETTDNLLPTKAPAVETPTPERVPEDRPEPSQASLASVTEKSFCSTEGLSTQ